MRIFIQPAETLLFRTGHPFNAGENNYAETLFPPTPETLQGAIRATIAAHWNPDMTLVEAFQQKELVDLIGNQEHYGRLCISCIALGRRQAGAGDGEAVERLFPIPAHLWHEEGSNRSQVRLMPAPAAQVVTNLPNDMYLLYPQRAVKSRIEAMQGWLTEHGLWIALREGGAVPVGDIIAGSELHSQEVRTGIGINGTTKTMAEGMFYQANMIRMNANPGASFIYGLVVDVRLLASTPGAPDPSARQFLADEETRSLLRLPEHGWLLLGGERRAAYFEIVAARSEEHTIEQARTGNLLYFATPAALSRGWQPSTWLAPLSPPLALASERYQLIGGWRLTPGSSGGRGKTTRRCVPAGSVYFFRSSTQMPPFLTDYGWQIGYGITYTGELQS